MTITLKVEEEKELDGDYIIFRYDVSDEQFWEFANEDIKCELINGVLIIHSPASIEHEDIFGYLTTIFRYYLEKNKLGKVYGSRAVMKIREKWNPEPDIMVVNNDRLKNLKKGHLDGPANLVVEILSKSTMKVDLEDKLPEFLDKGVDEVWIINPFTQSINIHFPNNVLEYLDPKSTKIIDSKVLINLKLQVNWIWNREEFPAYKIINQMV